jgi:ribonuclease HII
LLQYVYMVTVGIDEVGRGSLAGPLVVGAVALTDNIEGLKDSKLLSKKRRTHYSQLILSRAHCVSLGWVSAEEIDDLGLTAAITLAINRALNKVSIAYDKIIIDGSFNFLAGNNKVECVIRADQKIPCVSAASIVAKVARDEWMCLHAAVEFPQYQFEKNVGYGTKAHLESLLSFGACRLHRKSFEPIRSMLTTLP